MFWVSAEFGVDHVAVIPECPRGLRTESIQFRMLLQDQERLEDCCRATGK
jgi:hypothetical protein